MRLTRVRFTVRRMMVAVAILALALIPIRAVVRSRYHAYYERAMRASMEKVAEDDVRAEHCRQDGDASGLAFYSQRSRARRVVLVRYALLRHRYASGW